MNKNVKRKQINTENLS